ncbi:YopX family protein [Lactiplantibacillus plantarum]|uniref:YopX family protein n=1 Tax=Lactiplantibacillus plantarum TaxID=1590 RepID=UPI0020182F90|nr:YopX family protein [Lactiplantibacillus plantarum]UQN21517.1 YopX family protein [Lactiplantibacillus plantarum]
MIKFRAWDKENEIYLYNVQYAYDMLNGFVKYDDGENASYDECCFGDFLDNKRYDVEQFTGLKDVNGRDIYIGDVVKVWSDHSELTMSPTVNEIVSEDLFRTPGMFLKPLRAHFIEPCLHDYWSNQFEVIGNVHENPELLEADK